MGAERTEGGTGDVAFTPMATFTGVRRVPLVAIWHNSLCPSLTVGPDAVTLRVHRTHVLPFAELDHIAVRRLLGWQFTFVPRRGLITYTAGFFRADAARLAGLLRARGAPLPAAQAARLAVTDL